MAWAAVLAVQVPFLAAGGRPLNLAVADLVLVAALVVSLPRLRVRTGMWSGWLLALPITFGVSIITIGSLTRYTLLNKLIGMAVLLLSYLVVTSSVRSWRDLARVLRAFFVGVVVTNGVALLLFLAHIELPLFGCATCFRFVGFMPDPNLNASILALSLALFVAVYDDPVGIIPTHGRWLSAATLAAGLLLSLSRSGLIMLVAALATIALLQGRRAVVRLLAAAVVLVALTVAILAFEPNAAELTEVAARTHSVDSRVFLTLRAIDGFAENPLFGIGLGTYADRYGQIVHNTPLWLAAELGVVGFVLFGGLTAWVSVRLVRAYRRTEGSARDLVVFLIAGHVGMLTFSMIVEALYQRHWWLLIALAAGVDGNVDRYGVAVSPAESTAAGSPRSEEERPTASGPPDVANRPLAASSPSSRLSTPPRGSRSWKATRAVSADHHRDRHDHDYRDSRTVGGITRRECAICGYVSFADEDVDEER